MSASLVGSEMCIRDRHHLHTLPLQYRPRSAEAPFRRGPVPQRPCSAEAPVSYTHLTLPTICSV
eukprot:13800756-Alexandrium_andersonii.AAC.1